MNVTLHKKLRRMNSNLYIDGVMHVIIGWIFFYDRYAWTQ
jgi:hypothetical protein